MIGLVGARCARADGAGLLETWAVGIDGGSFELFEGHRDVARAIDWLSSEMGRNLFSPRPAPIVVQHRTVPAMCGERAWFTGWPGQSGYVTVGPEWSRLTLAAARENLVRHELLHALGFEHSNNPLSLMHPRVGWWPVRRGLLPGEREEVRRVYG